MEPARYLGPWLTVPNPVQRSDCAAAVTPVRLTSVGEEDRERVLVDTTASTNLG